MTDSVTFGTTGIPLFIMNTNEFDSWLVSQNSEVKSWLNHINYEGKGLALIPDQQGTLSFVIYGALDLDNVLFAGDLPLLLPSGQYYFNHKTHLISSESLESTTLNLAIGWGLGSYKFLTFKTQAKEDTQPKTPELVIHNSELVEKANNIIQATSLVRDLVNSPANHMMPENIAHATLKLSEEFSGSVNQIIGQDLIDQGFPCVHAVGRASIHAPRLIELNWGDESLPTVTLIGKGVCFDSGGLDIKPSSAMRLMKKDMGGAAHVLGLAKLIMSESLPVHLRVIIPAVENTVSGNSFRPGDILPTRKGLNIEIDNTDAEGRLVLCDALTYVGESSNDIIIDFATLTGAARVALGTEVGAFFCNNSDVAQQLQAFSEQLNDPLWQLPLYKPYEDMLKSQAADLLNCDPSGLGGAITAALYLQYFVSPETDWIHFDVMAWNKRKMPGKPVGGEAFGIRATFEFLKTRYGTTHS